jgi:hypothetical protein
VISSRRARGLPARGARSQGGTEYLATWPLGPAGINSRRETPQASRSIFYRRYPYLEAFDSLASHLDRSLLVSRNVKSRIPASSPLSGPQSTRAVLFACCNEGSTAVNCGTPRYRPSAGQRVSPGTVGRFPSSQPGTFPGGPRFGMGCRAHRVQLAWGWRRVAGDTDFQFAVDGTTS